MAFERYAPARGAWGGATPLQMVWTRPNDGFERIETICSGGGGPGHAAAVVHDPSGCEVPEGQPEAPGVGLHRCKWSGPDSMMVWNGSEPSPTAGAAPDTPRPPSGRNAAGARPGELDDFGLPRRTHRIGRDGVDDERSPRLRWLENSLRGVARGQRVPSHPLYLPVPVATGSYERRVFACASPSSLRPSLLLGSLHHSAHSRSGGSSKTTIPSQSSAARRQNTAQSQSRSIMKSRVRTEIIYPAGRWERRALDDG